MDVKDTEKLSEFNEEWLKRKIKEKMQFIEKTFKNLSFEVFIKYETGLKIYIKNVL